MDSVPSWYIFVLLTLAAFRIYRLLAKDTILDGPRSWLLRIPRNWREGQKLPDGYRDKLGTFLTCPWCAGFWISGATLAAYCIVADWFQWFGFLIVWLAMSSLVALAEKTLDSDE